MYLELPDYHGEVRGMTHLVGKIDHASPLRLFNMVAISCIRGR